MKTRRLLFAIFLAVSTSASVHIAQADENIKVRSNQPIKPTWFPLIQRAEQKETTPSWLTKNSVSDYLQRKAVAEQEKASRRALQQPRLPPDIIEGQKTDPAKLGKRQIYGGRKAVDDFVQGKSESLSGYNKATLLRR